MVSDRAQQDSLMLLPETFARSRRSSRGSVPLPHEAPWPRQSSTPVADNRLTLPIPEQDIFQIPEKREVSELDPAKLSRRAELVPDVSRQPIPGSVPVTEGGLQFGPVLAR
jgi:hypothetical protein